MRKKIPGSLLIIISGLILFSFSCAPQSCIEVTESFVKAAFYEKVLENGKDLAKIHPPDSLTMIGIGMDTNKLYHKTLKVQPALIPLNADTSNCTFIIRINGVTDTMSFWYNSYPHMVSKECGYTYYHTLDSVKATKHIIDTVLIINRSITTINEENIRIFF